MLEFMAGLSVGVYVGSYYECKPLVDWIRDWIKVHLPERQVHPKSHPHSKHMYHFLTWCNWLSPED